MEGNNQITVKDWMDHLRWHIEYLESQKNHYENFRIPTITLLFIFLSTFATSIINFQWIYGLLSLMVILFSAYMLSFINKKGSQYFKLSDEIASLLNSILLQDNVVIDGIRIEFMEISSRHGSLDESGEMRLEELKGRKEKK